MLDRSTLKWFVRGFGLTILVVLVTVAVIQPPLGRAAEDQGNLPFSRPAGTEGAAGPAGTGDSVWMVGPLADDSAPLSNLEAGKPDSRPVMLSSEEAAGLEAQILQVQSSPLVIPAADFRDDGFDPSSQFFSFGGGYQQGTAAGYGCMMAPAYLPAGAQLDQLFSSVYDNSGSRDITVDLWRVNNFDGAVDLMAQASTAGMPAAEGIIVISDLSIDFPSILYPDYSYYVTTCAQAPEIRLYSVRLYYSGP
jgi:hypothetical protein